MVAILGVSESPYHVFDDVGENCRLLVILPYSVVTLLDMIRIYGDLFFGISALLGAVQTTAWEDASPLSEEDRIQILSALHHVRELCLDADLPLSILQIERIVDEMHSYNTFAPFGKQLAILRDRIKDELKSVYLLRVPSSVVFLYEDAPQFGEAVAAKFPKSVTDIQEAAKCLATGRYTATVFHLMRVTEAAVQFLGRKLNINLVDERNWHNILDEVDKAIKRLPVTNARQKAIRNKYSEASAHLRMVKDAWRNDVMHPKETYTDEEAERVFRNVKDFMVHLAAKL